MDEEQEMELEALEAIYMDEFTLICDKVPRKFTLNVAPDGEIDEDTTTMAVRMKVVLPESYPDVIPIIKLKSTRGVTDNECAELVEELNSLAEENLGTQMIFTLASHIQEWMITTQQNEEERKENPKGEELTAIKKRQGTLVTRELFLAWKEKFDAETREKEGIVDTTNLGKTGRQLFEEDSSLFEDKEEEIFVEDSSLFIEEDGLDFE